MENNYRKKKTKIVATLSDFRTTEEFVHRLYDAGMDVVRINSAHVTEEGAAQIVEIVHRVNPSIPVMLDTKGPEIRVTAVAAEYGSGIEFRTGDRVAVRGSVGADDSTRETIYMNVPTIVRDIPVGARMLIADGELEICVVSKSDDELLCEFITGGTLRSRKSVNVPGVSIDLPSVTEKDRRFIEWATQHDVDFIAHSFVRSARDVEAVQAILDTRKSPIKIISKIENQEGLDNIDEIIEASYGIMVARGDLGVELPAEVIPNAQRRIVEKCIAAKRPVIIATQMLYSMVHSPRPTRAEVSDVASAIYERVDAVMLSDETATGDYPTEAVQTMARVAREIERDENHFRPMIDMNMVSVNHEITAPVGSIGRARFDQPAHPLRGARHQDRAYGTLPGSFPRSENRCRHLLYVACTAHSGAFLRGRGDSAAARHRQSIPFLADALDFLDQYGQLSEEDLFAIVGGSFGEDGGASYVEIAPVKAIRQRNAAIAAGEKL